MAEALYFVAGFAALADLAPPGRAGEALSYNPLALYLGLATGPMIGQALLGLGGFPLAWIGASLLLVVAAVLAGRVPETLQPSLAPGLPAPLIHPAALVPGLGLFTGVAAVSGFLPLMPSSGYTIRALDESTWAPFAALVERNNGVFGGCWCMGFHAEGVGTKDTTPAPNRARKLERVSTRDMLGIRVPGHA